MKYKFTAKDFWKIVEEKQNFKCALTGRLLEPNNTEIELKRPLAKGGKVSIDNHYAVDMAISKLARYFTEEEIINLAAEVIQYRGKEYGFKLEK